MENAANVQVLQDIYTAWNTKDQAKLLSCMTEDCVYEDMAMAAVMHGHEGVGAFMTEVYKTMPDFHVEYLKVFASDHHAAGQWLIKATWNGEYEGVDCTGKRIEFTGISYYHFKDGKVARTQDCWDSTQMMLAFGVLPEALRALAK